MEVLKFKSNVTGPGSFAILMLSVLALLAMPASACARDDNAVATLRADRQNLRRNRREGFASGSSPDGRQTNSTRAAWSK